jgi:tRNA (guanosine-2'-O-)-methyltransferase
MEDMNRETLLKFKDFLAEYVQEDRKELFNNILDERTRYLTVVLEDIYQPQNASAVIRSCDCFGIQDAHIIENQNEYQINPLVVHGASNWIEFKKYNEQENNTLDCINKLKDQGYRIVATSPHANDTDLPDFDITKGKTALVFGSEGPGISDIVKENADEFMKIPMYGFTESFNISVSAAICLSHISSELRRSEVDYHLQEEERDYLFTKWMKQTVLDGDKMEREFYRRLKEGKL